MTDKSVDKGKFRVAFFQRKPRKFGNFSVEFIFDAIRNRLPPDVKGIYYPAKYESQGLLKRLYISLEASFRQEDVNHITGDIHFLSIFLKKSKTALTILDVGFMKHPSKLNRFFLKLFWINLPISRAKVVIAISEATKNEILKYAKCSPAKIRVIHVPISGQFTFQPKAFNADKPSILQLGCAFNKNLIRTIEALKDIPCHLEIIGKPGEEEVELLKKYDISYQVSYNISQEEVLQKYYDCDIVTLVSTYEGFGMPIVEANAVGRPVITSNILSMPEVAGEAACLVDPFNIEEIRKGFKKIIDDEVYRNTLITEGLKNHKRFSIESITNQHADLYRQLKK